MKIYVGTANWGQEYGINKVKVPPKEIDKILNLAINNNIGIETAWDYKCMDELECLGDQFDIIFKHDKPAELMYAWELIGKDITSMKHHPPYNNYKHRSIYNVDDIALGDTEFPYNIIDQRFRRQTKSLGGKSIARSVFIQGLAFGMPDFHGIPFYHLCWNFVRNDPNIDGIVVGVDTADQLRDILNIPNYEIDYSNIGGAGWIRTL